MSYCVSGKATYRCGQWEPRTPDQNEIYNRRCKVKRKCLLHLLTVCLSCSSSSVLFLPSSFNPCTWSCTHIQSNTGVTRCPSHAIAHVPKNSEMQIEGKPRHDRRKKKNRTKCSEISIMGHSSSFTGDIQKTQSREKNKRRSRKPQKITQSTRAASNRGDTKGYETKRCRDAKKGRGEVVAQLPQRPHHHHHTSPLHCTLGTRKNDNKSRAFCVVAIVRSSTTCSAFFFLTQATARREHRDIYSCGSTRTGNDNEENKNRRRQQKQATAHIQILANTDFKKKTSDTGRTAVQQQSQINTTNAQLQSQPKKSENKSSDRRLKNRKLLSG